MSKKSFPVGTQYCGDIGILLDLDHDIDRLCIEIEVVSLYDIFFQYHNDVVAIMQRNIKRHVVPIFGVVLTSDEDRNGMNNNGKHVDLFHLSNYSDKLYGDIVYKMQVEMSNFIQVLASLLFAAISEF